MRKIIFLFALIIPLNCAGLDRVEKWDFFEIALKGSEDGNPFVDVQLEATFSLSGTSKTVKGFYDGNGIYKIRFMPEETGTWSYITKSNEKKLNGKKGGFECIAPSANNHGKVEVDKQYHFKYSDGTPYYPFGTTCYAWTHQSDSLQEITLKTLSNAPFNKLRMCVFPKHMNWVYFDEPLDYTYEGEPKKWDFYRFNPVFFDKLERRILQLDSLGIECDLILFHPYDKGRWGFDNMKDDQDDLYIRYLIARLASFKNIWWSVANEFDLLEGKQMEDWDRFFNILVDEDPYHHLRSIHNCKIFYDHTKPRVTHASIQEFTWDTREWIKKYQKPVIVDECRYEGNNSRTTSDLTAEAMTQQFWDAVTKGGYATHGEVYLGKYMWWAAGGVLHGTSPERIGFLRKIIEEAPTNGLTSFNGSPIKWNRRNSVRIGDEYFLFYVGERQPIERDIELPEDKKYKVDVIDTWNMTITPIDGLYSGVTTVPLGTAPYKAIRAVLVEE